MFDPPGGQPHPRRPEEALNVGEYNWGTPDLDTDPPSAKRVGKPNRLGRDETAAILNISASTVDTHLQRAKEKLAAAENLVQFVRMDAEELADPEFPDEGRVSDEANSSSDITPLS